MTGSPLSEVRTFSRSFYLRRGTPRLGVTI